jgi:hypothetical protein
MVFIILQNFFPFKILFGCSAMIEVITALNAHSRSKEATVKVILVIITDSIKESSCQELCAGFDFL